MCSSLKKLHWPETESDKRILCVSKPCGVEVKLSKSWLPTFRHITESTDDNHLVPWRIHLQNFLLKPNVDKNLCIRTISRGDNWREVWIRHCRNSCTAWTFLQVVTPTLFLRLFSFHFLLAVITLFLQTLAFYHVNGVKIHTSEQQLNDLGSHF